MDITFNNLKDAIQNGDFDHFKHKWSLVIANRVSNDSYFLLHWTMVYGRVDFMTFMLEEGANPNVQANEYTTTPIELNQWKRDNPIAKQQHLLLLRYGANPWQGPYWVNWLYLNIYSMVQLVCGEADDLPLDIWRVVKSFIL